MRGSDERTGSLSSYVGIEGGGAAGSPSARGPGADRRGDIAALFLTTLMARPRVKRLLSSDHLDVDGTMIQAWSSMKSVKPIDPGKGSSDEPPSSSCDRNVEADFHGETRSNVPVRWRPPCGM